MILLDPGTYKQAMIQPDASKWAEAIELKLKRVGRLFVFSTPVMLPNGAISIGVKMNRTVDGEIESHKAVYYFLG